MYVGITLHILQPWVIVLVAGGRPKASPCINHLAKMARAHLCHSQNSSLISIWQSFPGCRQDDAFRLAGLPTRACPLWRWGQFYGAFTRRGVVYWQISQGKFSEGTPYLPYSVLPSRSCSRIHATFGSAASVPDWLERINECRGLIGWQQYDASDLLREVRRDSAEYKSFCSSQEKQPQMYLQGSTPNYNSNQGVLLASGISYSLPHVPTLYQSQMLRRIRQNYTRVW